ncbi:hypothetical protein JMJ58_03775 [Haloterrigena salifodinae]|uniref:Uncharacterized protein n=1 Tax=Haloterrigena salifodinae TaxID=2675099 RepID=A0A8T8E2P5_9EURY|nr:hypothetical protein [Haloterrigena salifodinae]QRV16028.1 hypothetical protein JMJ58_03775 [Haloterrigena salifodinae]
MNLEEFLQQMLGGEEHIPPGLKVVATIVQSDKPRWTTEEMHETLGEEVSEACIRETFNRLAFLGILKHKSNSPYWYPKPEVLG